MTNQEAIETIKTAIAEVEWNYPLEYAVAFEKAIEEMSELTKALLKERRNEKTEVIKSSAPLQFILNIIEDIADVEIMLEQLKMIYDCGSQVEEMKGCKIERLQGRLKNENHSK